MIRKVIKYNDFDNNPVEETAYFHISTAEAVRMETGVKGGMSAFLEKLAESGDSGEMLRWLEKIISQAYGFKSEDGKKFLKDKAKTDDFMESEAYSAMLLEFLQEPDSIEKFLVSLFPSLNKAPAVPPVE